MRMRAMYSTVTTQALSLKKSVLSQSKAILRYPQGQQLQDYLLAVISAIIHPCGITEKCGHLLCFAASVSTDQCVVVHHPHQIQNICIKIQVKKKFCRHAMSVCQVHTQPTIDSPIVHQQSDSGILSTHFFDVIISMTLESSAQTQTNVHHSLLSNKTVVYALVHWTNLKQLLSFLVMSHSFIIYCESHSCNHLLVCASEHACHLIFQNVLTTCSACTSCTCVVFRVS